MPRPLLLCYSEVNKVERQEEAGEPEEKMSATGCNQTITSEAIIRCSGLSL